MSCLARGDIFALCVMSAVCATHAANAAPLPANLQQTVCQSLTNSVPAAATPKSLAPRYTWQALPALANHSKSVFQHAALRFGFAADLVSVDLNADTEPDLAYGVDVAGQLWRFALPGSRVSSVARLPAATRLAELAGSVHTQSDPLLRTFSTAPAVAIHTHQGTGERVVVIAVASGWQAYPQATQQADGLFIFRDAAPLGGADVSSSLPADTAHHQVLSWQQAAQRTTLTAPLLLVHWLQAPGEKVLNLPLILHDVALFISYVPPAKQSSSSCPPVPGTAKLYSVNLNTAEAGLSAKASSRSLTNTYQAPDILPVSAAWLDMRWSWLPTTSQTVLDLAGYERLGPDLPRRVEKLTWRKLTPGSSIQ